MEKNLRLGNDNYTGNSDDFSDDNDGDDDKNDDDDLAYLPIDKGWAWAILAGATLEAFLYGGMLKSYGVFFVEFQKRFGSNASETNVMQTIHNITVSLAGVLITNVGFKYISSRTMVFIGGVLTLLSYLVSAFLTDIRVMSLTIGFIGGVSKAMLFLPFVASVGIYFKRHRGLANSIHVSGSSIGSLVFGPLYTALFDYYGYTGTMMLVSAILFNSVIGGGLIRPISFYKRKRKWKELKVLKRTVSKPISKSDNENEPMIKKEVSVRLDENCIRTDTNVLTKGNISPSIPLSKDQHQSELLVKEDIELSNVSPIKAREDYGSDVHATTRGKVLLLTRSISHNPDTVRDLQSSPKLGRLRTNTQSGRVRTVSETLTSTSLFGNLLDSISRSKIALYASGELTCESIGVSQLNAVEIAKDGSCTDTGNSEVIENKSCVRQILGFLRTVFDVSVFGAVFIHYMCLAVFCISGSVMMSVYLIPYAKEVGATSADVSIIFVVISCVDLISRIFTGFLADQKWLKPTTIVAIDYIIIGVMCNFIRFFNQFWSLVVFAIVQGACAGCYICLYNIILIEHMGLNKFKSCIGFTAMFHGTSIAAFYQLTGLLRDRTGNYQYTYHLIGFVLLLGSVLSLTLPLTSSFVEKRSEKRQNM